MLSGSGAYTGNALTGAAPATFGHRVIYDSSPNVNRRAVPQGHIVTQLVVLPLVMRPRTHYLLGTRT